MGEGGKCFYYRVGGKEREGRRKEARESRRRRRRLHPSIPAFCTVGQRSAADAFMLL